MSSDDNCSDSHGENGGSDENAEQIEGETNRKRNRKRKRLVHSQSSTQKAMTTEMAVAFQHAKDNRKARVFASSNVIRMLYGRVHNSVMPEVFFYRAK